MSKGPKILEQYERNVFVVSFFLLLFSPILVIGQADASLRHCVTKEYSIDFHIRLDVKKKRFQDTTTYYWYKSDEIKTSQGGAAGKLLHGSFEKYDSNGNLLEQGNFENGLKSGEWKYWYSSGQLSKRCVYKEGRLNGDLIAYSEDGDLNQHVRFRKGTMKVKRKRDTVENQGEEKKSFFKKLREQEAEKKAEKKANKENDDSKNWFDEWKVKRAEKKDKKAVEGKKNE